MIKNFMVRECTVNKKYNYTEDETETRVLLQSDTDFVCLYGSSIEEIEKKLKVDRLIIGKTIKIQITARGYI